MYCLSLVLRKLNTEGGKVATKENIAKAVSLVNHMVNLSTGERQLLKKRIAEAAQGDEWALGYVQRFLYDGSVNRAFTKQILDLIRKN